MRTVWLLFQHKQKTTHDNWLNLQDKKYDIDTTKNTRSKRQTKDKINATKKANTNKKNNKFFLNKYLNQSGKRGKEKSPE